MAHFLPVDEVYLLSTDVESMLYGAFFIMYMICVWVLVKRCDPDRGVNKLMLITATAMLVVATMFEAVSIQEDVQAFIQHKDGSVVLYYAVVSSFLNLFHSALFGTQILIGDAILIYRMYIVYERRLLTVVFSITVWIASAVTSCMVIFQFSRVDSSGNPGYFTQNVLPWSRSNIALFMSQNVISTVAIAFRLWWVGRRMATSGSRLWRSAAIFLESGLPYTLTLVIFMILYLKTQNIFVFAYYGVVPMAGISMTGLLIRVGLRTYDEVMTSSLSGSGRTDPHKEPRSGFLGPMVFSHPTRTQDTTLSTATDLHAFDDTASGHMVDRQSHFP
ncbi:hypothetical protein JB92DRAFT_3117553 [Gautieria morchelliformis]|nr:hypothetical protein JB92DRAFT_3117553 [Gautieria morchelliformis]